MKNLFEGGIFFMLPIYLLWIVVIILAIRFILRYRSNAEPKSIKRTNDTILFIGSFAFLFGLLGQIFGLFGAFNAIQEAADISPAILAGGLKVSFLAPVYGFVLFLISGVIWFIYRNLIPAS